MMKSILTTKTWLWPIAVLHFLHISSGTWRSPHIIILYGYQKCDTVGLILFLFVGYWSRITCISHNNNVNNNLPDQIWRSTSISIRLYFHYDFHSSMNIYLYNYVQSDGLSSGTHTKVNILICIVRTLPDTYSEEHNIVMTSQWSTSAVRLYPVIIWMFTNRYTQSLQRSRTFTPEVDPKCIDKTN
jgi:hypothetical protein